MKNLARTAAGVIGGGAALAATALAAPLASAAPAHQYLPANYRCVTHYQYLIPHRSVPWGSATEEVETCTVSYTGEAEVAVYVSGHRDPYGVSVKLSSPRVSGVITGTAWSQFLVSSRPAHTQLTLTASLRGIVPLSELPRLQVTAIKI